jgi:hypothetical protein
MSSIGPIIDCCVQTVFSGRQSIRSLSSGHESPFQSVLFAKPDRYSDRQDSQYERCLPSIATPHRMQGSLYSWALAWESELSG